MNKEDKDLLLKYLCMALPYHVRCHVPSENCVMTLTGKRLNYFCFHKDEWDIDYSHELETVLDPLNDQNNEYVVKPHLRPMSSMTEEEKEEYQKLRWTKLEHYTVFWLLENHFDFMGLIPKGLALEASGGMYGEFIGVKESPSETFPRINEFDTGSSYRV